MEIGMGNCNECGAKNPQCGCILKIVIDGYAWGEDLTNPTKTLEVKNGY